jgi:hypothetical protein
MKNMLNITHILHITVITLACALIYLGNPASTMAQSAADKRIAAVIAHVKEHPVNEITIGTHPKHSNAPFSRLFNISLSARAYFQLHTQPSLDASSNQDLEKVARYYLDHPDTIEDPDSSYWAGEYHASALAKFGSHGTVRKGAISRKTELLLLEYMYRYVNYWSRLKHYDASLKYQTYYYWSTENHWWQEIVVSWGYLLALKDDPQFKDRKLIDGKSFKEHYERTCLYMKQHMQQRARKGFLLEISSGGYSSRMHNMWYLIHDISPDPNLRDLARNSLDLYWAFWAEEELAAERGGGKVRHRDLRGLGPNSEAHLIPAWLFFGVGTKDLNYIKSIKPDETALAVHFIILFSGYRPNEVIYKILEDRGSAPPYSITQRRLGKEVPSKKVPETAKMAGNLYDIEHGDCLKYSWVTKNFILGTVMRPPYEGEAWQKGTAQGWWHGLLISSGDPHLPPERVVPTLIQEKDISSDQYAVQSKGSMMTRKILRGHGRDNSRIPLGIFISSGLQKYTEHSGNFLFINSPHCWVAVRSTVGNFVLSNQILLKNLKAKGDFYKPANDLNPLIIEAADPGSYKNFETFKQAVLDTPLTTKEGRYAYASLSGDLLTMFDDRTKPQINQKTINYNPEMAYDSRYVKSKWDSGIIEISAGGTKTVLNFMAE